MKWAHLQCASGIAGDMMLAALLDAGASLDVVQSGIDSLGLPTCRLEIEIVKRHGFRAANLIVRHEPEHAHRHLSQIQKMIDASNLSVRARDFASRIFLKLAEAEALVHGSTIEKVHFHEVGAVDSIADIVGTAIALDVLEITRLTCEPIPTGHGTIEIAHGMVSIPAPATAELLKGIPLRPSDVPFELTTPTGAAIVATLAESFGRIPAMSIEKIGCGAGDRDLPGQANVLRVLIGSSAGSEGQLDTDQVSLLETNLDDSTGEEIGYCIEQLWKAGALDVFTTPIQMKKNRPGVTLSVLCRPDAQETIQRIMFCETSTIGIRATTVVRTKLPRTTHDVTTEWGAITGKLVTLPDGQQRFSPEYDVCSQIATLHNQPVAKIIAAAKAVYLATA